MRSRLLSLSPFRRTEIVASRCEIIRVLLMLRECDHQPQFFKFWTRRSHSSPRRRRQSPLQHGMQG